MRAVLSILKEFLKVCFISVDKPRLFGSYQVPYKVADSKEPHTTEEELIKQGALEMDNTFLGQEAGKNFKSELLSNRVIHSEMTA